MQKIYFTVVVCMIACSAFSCRKNVAMPQKQDEALKQELLQIAKEYLKQHHPEYVDELYRPIEIIDKEHYWELRTQLPPGAFGGGPVILIEKGTKKVTRVDFEE